MLLFSLNLIMEGIFMSFESTTLTRLHCRPVWNVELHMLIIMLMRKISCSCWVALDWLGTCEVHCLKGVLWWWRWWWWWWWWYSSDSSVGGGDQCVKKVMSHSLELVDFAIKLVNSVLNSPDGQVNFCGGEGEGSHYRRTVINAHEKYFCASGNDFWANTC